jgi:hypothetical protein
MGRRQDVRRAAPLSYSIGPNVSVWETAGCGRRSRFQLRILGAHHYAYPDFRFHRRGALYGASPSLVYTVVPAEEPNEYGFSEIAWANVGEIRLWGAIAFSIQEGRGFYSFHPIEHERSGGSIWAENLTPGVADRFAQRLARALPEQAHDLHWIKPNDTEVGALYDALLQADNVLLRGVSCYLKSHLLWRHYLFAEEMGINLYIALEAGLSIMRRRMSAAAGRQVAYDDVFEFIRRTFAYGDPLVKYWQECRDDRNMLIHPDCDLGSHVMPPMSHDDIWELLDPMLSLYRYILLGQPRPANLV